MSCCGQNRDSSVREARLAPVRPAAPPRAPVPAPIPAIGHTVTLRCRNRSALDVQGPVTGKRYRFANGGSMHAIDRRDAEGLLATGLFERIWG